MSVLRGEHAWLEHGIAAENTEMGDRRERENGGTAENGLEAESEELLAAR